MTLEIKRMLLETTFETLTGRLPTKTCIFNRGLPYARFQMREEGHNWSGSFLDQKRALLNGVLWRV